MFHIRRTIIFLFGILILAAILLMVLQHLRVKSGEDKGGVPNPSPTVSVLETPTTSVGPTATPTALRGRRILKRAGGYSLIMPDGWVDRESGPYHTSFTLSSNRDERDLPRFSVQAVLGSTSVQWFERYAGPPGSIRIEPVELEHRHNVEVDNWEWQRFATADPKDEIRKLYVLTDREGGGLYLIFADSWTKDWDTYLPIFEGIIASFAFEKIETPPPVTQTAVPTATQKAAP